MTPERVFATSPGPAARYTHRWRARAILPERYGQRCRPIASGMLRSVLVEFADGVRYVSSRHFIRREAP